MLSYPNHYERNPHHYLVLHNQGRSRCLQRKHLLGNIHRKQIAVECAVVGLQWSSARDSDPRLRVGRPLTLDIAGNDPRHGPRCSCHVRSRYHIVVTAPLSGCSQSLRDRRALHDLLRCRHRAQSPIGAHFVPFFRQKKLRCAVPQEV